MITIEDLKKDVELEHTYLFWLSFEGKSIEVELSLEGTENLNDVVDHVNLYLMSFESHLKLAKELLANHSEEDIFDFWLDEQEYSASDLKQGLILYFVDWWYKESVSFYFSYHKNDSKNFTVRLTENDFFVMATQI